MYQNITISALLEMRASGEVAVVDVRSAAEAARGMIDGALLIPLPMLPIKTPELDNTAAIVVYCHSGVRSAQACAFLASKGFGKVYNLQGGILAWLQSGLSLGQPAA